MLEDEVASHMDRLRGRILGAIESWGLPAVQERGVKGTFKTLTYDMESDLKRSAIDLETAHVALQRAYGELTERYTAIERSYEALVARVDDIEQHVVIDRSHSALNG